ncbi:centromere protein S-like [Limulus polyphemus]|uniref:Centromere protein S n=1 Tax=Limulus polyphemus TaxID=6850 RepID=A0ABM1BID1_LIMPO|nr:centromere protein S-like [Limulus polyphemus]
MDDQNASDDLETLTHVQHLKAAVHYTVAKICEETGEEKHQTFSRQSIATISELTYRQIGSFAEDLELFARHAKRSMVGIDDVKLLVRKSLPLANHITQLAETLSSGTEEKKKKKPQRRKKKVSSTDPELNYQDNSTVENID